MTAPAAIALAGLALLLGGCATSSAPVRFQLLESDPEAGAGSTWPAPPQVPRYRYLGTLTGEANYRRPADAVESTASRVLRWLVGLGSGTERLEQLGRPQGGTVDARGRILVTDLAVPGVFLFDPEAEAPEVWTEATPGQLFKSPIEVAHSPRGGYYVSDSALALVARLGPDGGPMEPITDPELRRPTGLALDPDTGYLYVADSEADDIKVYDRGGARVDLIGGPGTGPGQFNGPTFLDFQAGRLYVTDTLNARIQVLDRAGHPLDTIGRRGLYVGNFVRPKGVGVDEEGHVYATESYYDHLLVFGGEGRFLLGIGGSGGGAGRFMLPAGVWPDTRGRVFVADMMNARVVVLQYLGDAGE